VADKRCTFKCGDWNCGSYQFNLYKADIDQGDLCDVHYWQTKAQREWVGLTDEEYDKIWRQDLNNKDLMDLTIAKLKERNT
jgi:hypothetical protein